MRTSLNEVALIDSFLLNKLSPPDKTSFEVRLLLETELYENTQLQKQVHQLVKEHGREKLRNEIDAVHHQLFTRHEHRGFAALVKRFFLG